MLQDWLPRDPAEVVVWAALALVLALIGVALGRSGRAGAGDDDDLEAEARRWIKGRIDEYVSILAEVYGGEAVRCSDADELPPGFAAAIECFIAEVLLHQGDRAEIDVDLSVAIREFVVLHRAELYGDVIDRTREYLAAA